MDDFDYGFDVNVLVEQDEMRWDEPDTSYEDSLMRAFDAYDEDVPDDAFSDDLDW